EAVSVGQDAAPTPVAEDDRRGPVPRRNRARNPFRKRGRERMRIPPHRERLRDGREQRGLGRPAGQLERLEELVERERIGAVRAQERTCGEQATPGPGRRIATSTPDVL